MNESEIRDVIFVSIRDALSQTSLSLEANNVAVSIANGLSRSLSRLLKEETDRVIAHHLAAYIHQEAHV